MSKPGIEPVNNNNENDGTPPGITPAPKKKSHLGKILAGAAAVAVLGTALGLSQCDGDNNTPTPTPTPGADTPEQPQPTNQTPRFRYRVSEDTAMVGQYTTVTVKAGSCVDSVLDSNNNISRRGGDVEVQGVAADGVQTFRGFVSQSKLPATGYATNVACVAEFATAAPAPAAEIATGGAQQYWRVVGSARFYNIPNASSPVIGTAGDSSCVASTGKTAGDMMQVTVTGGNQQMRMVWTNSANYTQVQGTMTPSNCQAKTDLPGLTP